MNVDVRPIKTAAESALAMNFAAARGSLPGVDAVAALREEAFARFETDGLPSRRIEEWKYTDLRALMREAKPLAPLPDAAAKRRAGEAVATLASIEARRIVFVDGSFSAGAFRPRRTGTGSHYPLDGIRAGRGRCACHGPARTNRADDRRGSRAQHGVHG